MTMMLTLNWPGLLMTVLMWLVIVTVALWMIDRLFPRIHHNDDDRSR